MPDSATLLLFIPTMFLVSISPGMCMTLAMTLGLYVGIRKTLWMMVGELLGVALVAVSSVLAVAILIDAYPILLTLLKWIGAAYLLYLGIQTWSSKMSFTNESDFGTSITKTSLFLQGFATAIANPKGWVFMIALLPPLITPNKPMFIQTSVFVAIILVSELVCMMLYASSGRALRTFFMKNNNDKWMNRITSLLLIMVSLWLVVS
ncbi:LysE family translocator [Glaciecola sp. KUL10]|uniref:LysE family translocator n=1 Tax=Glaciecola sp. (strain KUL10) TaxID=2161813 RepID=UPI000D789342|nr:LysE family translocator [Glaciecola sp. KUL10]GBL06229.1 transporter, LysE family [Glaciecola sp. KUL10]